MSSLTRRVRRHGAERLNMKPTDIPNMTDAVFDGDDETPGWVIMCANPRGRELVNNLFPGAHIEWSDRRGISSDFRKIAPDWLGFKINVPDVVSNLETNLPLELISAGQSIEDCVPAQLAGLLAIGVKRAGGRAAVVRRISGGLQFQLLTPEMQ